MTLTAAIDTLYAGMVEAYLLIDLIPGHVLSKWLALLRG
jgi:hypothetical protein